MNERTRAAPEGPGRTLVVAASVCLVCSILVSASVQLLKPRQEANRARERERQIAVILARQPALADVLGTLGEVDVRARVVELATGLYADWIDPAELDPRRAERDPLQSVELPPERDPAGIGRRANLATVYEIRRAQRLELVVLPVHGSGYADTIRGFLALAPDGNTVLGLGFHEHRETPGLGGEIEDPEWLALWVGKELRDEEGRIRIGLTMDEVAPAPADAAYTVDGLSGATRTTNAVTNLVRFWVGEDGFAAYLRRIAS